MLNVASVFRRSLSQKKNVHYHGNAIVTLQFTLIAQLLFSERPEHQLHTKFRVLPASTLFNLANVTVSLLIKRVQTELILYIYSISFLTWK